MAEGVIINTLSHGVSMEIVCYFLNASVDIFPVLHLQTLDGSALSAVSPQVARRRRGAFEVAPAHSLAAQETSLLPCLIGILAFCSVLQYFPSALFSC